MTTLRVPEDQDKEMMVLSIRVGIPVKGFNALGQMTIAREYVEALRDLGADRRATTVIDEVQFA